MKYGFFFDQSRCIGCNTCTVACKDFNQIKPGPVRLRKYELYESGDADRPVFEGLSMACNHCENPACLNACTVDAISQTDEGFVVVDREKCQGLTSCITACPFAAAQIADDIQEPSKKEAWLINHPMQKCKFCWERIKDGEKPVCVGGCVVNALQFGEISDIQRKYPDAVRLNKADFPYAYKDGVEDDTKPCLFIKRRVNQLKIVNRVK